jgi:hypothetical protein
VDLSGAIVEPPPLRDVVSLRATGSDQEFNMANNREARALFITGLRNAHAMENQAISIMKPQV